MPWGRDQMTPLADDLASRGFAVWNLEYRRLGVPGAGWPGTMEDVATGMEHLAKLAAGGVALDLDRVTVVGHSAGGHLALWAAARNLTSRAPVRGVMGLAPISDLVPVELSRGYARAAAEAGDQIELVELPGAGHMDFLEPASAAHVILCRRLQTWSA